MRVIKLDGSEDQAQRAYLHLHAAMHATEVKGIEQIRRVGKIIDKLEAIGVQDDKGAWKLAPEGGSLWLEGAEYQEVKDRMGATAWLPAHARFIAKTFEMIDAASEEDPGKPKLVPTGPSAGGAGGQQGVPMVAEA